MITLTVQEIMDALAQLHPTDKVVVDVTEVYSAAIGICQMGDHQPEFGIDRVDPTPSTYGFHAIIRLNQE